VSGGSHLRKGGKVKKKKPGEKLCQLGTTAGEKKQPFVKEERARIERKQGERHSPSESKKGVKPRARKILEGTTRVLPKQATGERKKRAGPTETQGND